MSVTITGTTGVTFPDATTQSTAFATPVSTANGGTGATSLAAANIPVTTAANSFTNTQSFPGTASVLSSVFTNIAEVATVSATAATGTINFYTATQSVLYYTSNASGTFVVNLAHSAGTAMNTALATGQSVTTAFLVTQGGSGGSYYATAVQVDGTATGVTTKWQGGAPTSGNANGIDVYTFTVIKTASATYTVLASVVQFK